MIKENYLSDGRKDEFVNDPKSFFQGLSENKSLRDSRLMDAIEYDRTVHAEMAAITDAARRGVALRGCTLYCTTLPCHNCARHIVATGIRRVVYILPYEKSLAERLHDDAISMDVKIGARSRLVRFEHFIGIAPGAYSVLFSMRNKKRLKGGQFVDWIPNMAMPVTKEEPWVYLKKERRATEKFLETLSEKKLGFRRERTDYEPGRD